MTDPRAGSGRRRTAIVDIGSNSVRLVVYDGPARRPAILFNEKIMAGLGRGLEESGRIDPAALDLATASLARFARLCRVLEPDDMIAVATAAVRDAANGSVLVERAAALGIDVTILSGDREAELAALGVLSGVPGASGVVGDLGGGSLELVQVGDGTVGDRLSLPLGVLRTAGMRGRIDAALAQGLEAAGWTEDCNGGAFYLVGGSWRALARLDMHLSGYALPIIHDYRMDPAALGELAARIDAADKAELKKVPDLSSARIATLGQAVELLEAVVRRLRPAELVVSALGVRDGLLFERLDADGRASDPLIVAARDEAASTGRFPEHGDLLDRWIAPLFRNDGPGDRRLRHAACLLADTGWRANPEFRAERAREVALHGNWVGIDARGRAMMAQALSVALGDATVPVDPLPLLADAPSLELASGWGHAIRFAQRLSAGVASPLTDTRLEVADGALRLVLKPGDEDWYSDPVERRHRKAATSLGLQPELVSRT
ncbi:exopolyphosphatase/guanosine-5'-triphosphate,3'-diphosphate pyrophosphatase [Sphingomonas jejuensis]|uniref:Exopolyphosphatase/guanosine-5'-triphosphate, 3'-diphosphate pyrophosphatase n=1 Tax=Sphingomonas jejuensis TaxID=904715 RepID=A0ABX0XJ29_9SPHN|nr:exopolyphosphatase/guanosine-5'-triphosphate,3'-diphosphate pyrophosphatase [Sphingomonas jejuensis]